ncbi:hypothetical protein ACJMK2_037510 [Sinanodonta woodiana]|uniref:Uncharacterized protein n=1 Tax=Sinanodonta woodiana TaxID=1069815 RepID=A0ABD3WLY3_SINWO
MEGINEDVEEEERKEEEELSGVQPITSTPVAKSRIQTKIPMLKRKHSRNLSVTSSSDDTEFPPLQQVMTRTKMEKKRKKTREKPIPENKLELPETSDNDKQIPPLNLNSPPTPEPIMTYISTIK